MWPIINLLFLYLALNMVILGFLMNHFESSLPTVVVQMFRYGKFSASGSRVPGVIEVPKSFFRHFYLVAIFTFSLVFFLVVRTYFLGQQAPASLLFLLDLLCNSDRVATCSPAAVIVSTFLLTLQCYKRFYETFFIQVFSKESKINLAHYIIGHAHYFGCAAAILGHAPGFINDSEKLEELALFDVTTVFMMFISIPLFYVGYINQFRSNKILANLRKDKSAKHVVSEKHFIPKGGWFEVISAPHQLCEIMMYVALTYLLGMNTSWWCVLFWVVSNQIESALMSHWWYQNTFSNYPKKRKALIPYIL